MPPCVTWAPTSTAISSRRSSCPDGCSCAGRVGPTRSPPATPLPRAIRPGPAIAIVEEDREAARQAGQPIDYVIEAGDSLGAIANIWTVTLDALVAANPGIDPNSLQIGQLIVVPPFGTGYSPEELAAFSTPVPVERPPGEVLYHVVEPGDLLSALAEIYSVTVEEIMAANGIADANQLVVGQELAIPPPSQGG